MTGERFRIGFLPLVDAALPVLAHEIGFAEKVASRLIFIDKGRIAEDGDPQMLVNNPPSPRLREFLQHVA